MKKVVFACVHNAGRSQIAAAWFNELADPTKARAESAGTKPAEHVHPVVAETMKEVGIDLFSARPRFLSVELVADAAYLVTMGCGDECPVTPPGTRREDWPLEDPKGKPAPRVREIRDDIRDRVARLLESEGWARRPSA
jgi:arsenate reductase